MKERPIPFNGEMVRALLDGRKTQTRRVVKFGKHGNGEHVLMHNQPAGAVFGCDCDECRADNTHSCLITCPYGQTGDRLWAKETWQPDPCTVYMDGTSPVAFSATDSSDGRGPYGKRWRPSIHMPRWASRILIEVTGVRVQRVQEISGEDIEAEGVGGKTHASPVNGLPYEIYNIGDGVDYSTPKDAFAALWDSIYAAPNPLYETIDGKPKIVSYVSYPWDNIQQTTEYKGLPWVIVGNPYVWVVEFKMLEAKG